MSYPTYLVHFNQNHDKRNGQFTYGDGDGDGISNDHAHRSKGIRKAVSYRIKNGVYDSPGKTVGQQRVSTTRKKMGIFAGALAVSALVAGGAILINKLSKSKYNTINDTFDYEQKGSSWLHSASERDVLTKAIWDEGMYGREPKSLRLNNKGNTPWTYTSGVKTQPGAKYGSDLGTFFPGNFYK